MHSVDTYINHQIDQRQYTTVYLYHSVIPYMYE